MPEHLRALLVILALAGVVFAFARKISGGLFPAGVFEHRRNLWLGITLAAFLAHNFWVFIFAAGVLLLIAAAKDEDKVGLVLFVLLAVPLMRSEIQGVGGIRYLFDMDYFRLISLSVLLPTLIREANKRSWSYFFGGGATDRFLYTYLALNLVLMFIAGSVTGTMRSAFVMFTDVVLPYAVASRMIKDTPTMRSAMASYVVGACVMAAIGVFEFARSWLMYSALEDALGIRWNFGSYLRRDDALRAMATAGQAIPYGYAMAVGFCLMLGLRRFVPQKTLWLCGLGLLGLGLLASYSRGPWLGGAAGFLAFALTGPEKGKNVARLALAGFAMAAVLLASPLGDKLIEAATVESSSYDYRRRLFEISTGVMLENPFFGAFSAAYSPAMQEMKQGQGIIDIVNTYLAIGLRSGLVGLSLFVGFLFAAAFGVWRRIRSVGDTNGEVSDLGRGLLAALVCILVTIFTVSSVTFIPVIYYLFAGLAVGYVRLGRATPEASPLATQPVSQSRGARHGVAAIAR